MVVGHDFAVVVVVVVLVVVGRRVSPEPPPPPPLLLLLRRTLVVDVGVAAVEIVWVDLFDDTMSSLTPPHASFCPVLGNALLPRSPRLFFSSKDRPLLLLLLPPPPLLFYDGGVLVGDDSPAAPLLLDGAMLFALFSFACLPPPARLLLLQETRGEEVKRHLHTLLARSARWKCFGNTGATVQMGEGWVDGHRQTAKVLKDTVDPPFPSWIVALLD